MKEYLLITAIKNEVNNLPSLKDTILNQTVRPILWVIVDGGSTDGSYEIAKDIFSEYTWIHVIRQSKYLRKGGNSHTNFAIGINEGYYYAKKLYRDEVLDYFIGKTDATPQLSPSYFEVLIEIMDKDPSIAFLCGIQKLSLNDSKTVNLKSFLSIPFTGINDIRLYQSKFFDQVGGYPVSYCPDTVLQIKALNSNLNVGVTDKTYFVEPRVGGSKNGLWDGYILKGKAMYNLYYHPILLFMNAIFFSVRFSPHYQGIPLILGYLYSTFKKDERSNDPEIYDYFWNKRWKEVIYSVFNFRTP